MTAVRPIFQDRVLDAHNGSELPQFDTASPFLPLLNAVKQAGTRITAGNLNNLINPSNILAFSKTRTEYDYSNKADIWLKIWATDESPERLIYECRRKETSTGVWSVTEAVYDKALQPNGKVENITVQERRMEITQRGKTLKVVTE
jgi:hypothetical protein